MHKQMVNEGVHNQDMVRPIHDLPCCTGAPVHTRRILLPGLATRSPTVCPWCTGAPVYTRRILLPPWRGHSIPDCFVVISQEDNVPTQPERAILLDMLVYTLVSPNLANPTLRRSSEPSGVEKPVGCRERGAVTPRRARDTAPIDSRMSRPKQQPVHIGHTPKVSPRTTISALAGRDVRFGNQSLHRRRGPLSVPSGFSRVSVGARGQAARYCPTPSGSHGRSNVHSHVPWAFSCGHASGVGCVARTATDGKP
jgi:hypothetical protein